MAEEGSGKGLPLAAIRCKKLGVMRGGGGGLRCCRELPENGRNRGREEDAVGCRETPEIGRNGARREAAVGGRELPENGRNR